MIKTTIDSLRDFQACSLYYEFKHVKGMEPKESQVKKTQGLFKENLISIVNFFFFKKLAYQEPSYKALEHKWEKKWIKDTDPVDAVTKRTSATNAYPSDPWYTTKATAALREFHRWFSDKPNLEVVLIDEPFTVALTKEVALTGTLDLVLRNKKPDGSYKYHIYTWSVNMGNKSPDYWATHFTSVDYAFRYRNKFDPSLDVSYYLWDFTDPKPGVRSFLIEVKDHALLKRWADDLAKAEQYYPIRGLSGYCRGCKYDKPCRAWVPEELREEQITVAPRVRKAAAR